MFEQFYKQCKEKSNDNNQITLNLSKNMIMNPKLLWDKLSNIDNIDDKELFEILRQYYSNILDEIFVSKNDNFINLFTNPRFISSLTQVFYNVNISDSQRYRVNKMAYDYLAIKDHKTDEYIKGLLICMSKTVNRDKIPKICALQIPESVASLLVLARYSSDKEIINVKRLNHMLMIQPPETINEQLIVDIFIALFDHILPLFEGVMLDVSSPQAMSPGQSEIYGLITLAMLDLMNELPIESICHGLIRFIEDKRILYPDNNVRLNLESCSPTDYPRLLTAIDIIKQDGIYVPVF